jgi:16S rRNA (uracil1498-N3)-methyltransferase
MSDWSRRLFAPDLPADGGEVVLPAESARHARVLRLAEGARVQLFDGRSGQAEATIIELARDAITCAAEPRVTLPARSPALHLVLGVPKGGKLEDITRMLTELGVDSLHLAQCERSVPRLSSAGTRMDRLQRVALEACAQSAQPRAPVLHAPASLSEIATRVAPDARGVVFWEEAHTPLALDVTREPASEVWAVVGPEGGLSASEVDALLARGFVAAGLGPALLRVQTAAPVIAALLLDRIGRLRD